MVKTQQFSNGQNAEIFKWSKRKILKPSKHINGKTVKMKKKKKFNGQKHKYKQFKTQARLG